MARSPAAKRELDAFTRAYIEAALWSSTDNADDSGGEPLDKNYGPGDIAPATMAAIEKDCDSFLARFDHLVEDDDSAAIEKWGRYELAGHDFWLTRNGHGAGFGDGNFPKHDDELYEAAQSYGEFDLYVGDDGIIYASGHEGGVSEARRRRTREAPHRVADFSTLPELIEHARLEGATHTLVRGHEAQLFFPRADGRYDAAAVWQERGYWHAPAPSDRAIINRLPAGAARVYGNPGFTAKRLVSEASLKTKLDLILDQVKAGKREITLDTQGYTRDQVDRVIATAKQRGLDAAYDGRFVLIRDLRQHAASVVRDYIAVDPSGRTVAGPFTDYGQAKHEADRARGYVKFATEKARAVAEATRRRRRRRSR